MLRDIKNKGSRGPTLAAVARGAIQFRWSSIVDWPTERENIDDDDRIRESLTFSHVT